MSDFPPYTFIGSCYRNTRPDQLKLAIDSTFKQYQLPDQVILVVDGDIPDSLRNTCIALSLRYPKLEIIWSPDNKGLGLSLNLCLKQSRNELNIRFDTDDFNALTKASFLLSASKLFQHLTIIGSHVIDYKQVESSIFTRFKSNPLTTAEVNSSFWLRNPFNHPSLILRKSHVLAVGGYEDVPYFEDYFLWLKLRKHCFYGMNIPFALTSMNRPSMAVRRSGLILLHFEFYFLLKSIRRKYLSSSEIISFLLRLIIRPFVLLTDFVPWRNSWNPDPLTLMFISNR